jgi:hypothetical protein
MGSKWALFAGCAWPLLSQEPRDVQALVCSQKVTGPSLTSDTCMSAPNSPVSTMGCYARAADTK